MRCARDREHGSCSRDRRAGKTVPDDWGVDAQGNPTTDPAAILSGAMMLRWLADKHDDATLAIGQLHHRVADLREQALKVILARQPAIHTHEPR